MKIKFKIVILSILSAAAAFILLEEQFKKTVVSIEATGQNDPLSNSSEVWFAIEKNDRPVDLEQYVNERWMFRYGYLGSYADQPTVKRLSFIYRKNVSISFLGNDWSGIVLITEGKKQTKVNLYNNPYIYNCNGSVFYIPVVILSAVVLLLSYFLLYFLYKFIEAIKLLNKSSFESEGRSGVRAILFKITIMALLAGLAGFVILEGQFRESEIIIGATGQKNPLSAASEVWFAIEKDGQSLDLEKYANERWEFKKGRLLSNLDQPAQIRLRFEYQDNLAVKFTGHDWSGIAMINEGGKLTEVDLYNNPYIYNCIGRMFYPPIITLCVVLFLFSYVLFYDASCNQDDKDGIRKHISKRTTV